MRRPQDGDQGGPKAVQVPGMDHIDPSRMKSPFHNWDMLDAQVLYHENQKSVPPNLADFSNYTHTGDDGSSGTATKQGVVKSRFDISTYFL
jgi:hypothetical protein